MMVSSPPRMARRGTRDLLIDNPVFGLGSPSARAQLASRSRTLELLPSTRILSEGEPATSIFALEKGAVRVFHQAPTGDEVLLKLFRAPAIFGEAEAFYEVVFQENVETVEDTTLVAMPTDAVRDFLLEVPEAGLAFVRDLAARLAIASYHQRSLAFNPVTIRLANFLLDYAEWSNVEPARELTVALSQDDMAAAIGATRRSIGKDITTWQDEGILLRSGNAYLVRDPRALERYADPERLRLAYRLKAGAEAAGVTRPQPVLPRRVRTPRK